MAIIRSGVLGNTRGKVSGVVGSQWKDKNYLREYVKPANPKTAAQTVQRNLMAACVEFAKHCVGPVFNTYTDKFQKSMSGFNFFIKQNISQFVAAPDHSLIKLCEGKLHLGTPSVSVYTAGSGDVTVTFPTTLGNNGAADDQVFLAVYNATNGYWSFAAAEVDRSTGTISATSATGMVAANIHTYILAAKYAGAIVSLISDSVYAESVVP